LPNSTKEIDENSYVKIDVETGEILVGNKVLKGKGITGMALEILQAGGIMEYLKKMQTVNRN
jgi:3-isopropylmalate/(R)-2-methylmalate dehydratase small subunit